MIKADVISRDYKGKEMTVIIAFIDIRQIAIIKKQCRLLLQPALSADDRLQLFATVILSPSDLFYNHPELS